MSLKRLVNGNTSGTSTTFASALRNRKGHLCHESRAPARFGQENSISRGLFLSLVLVLSLAAPASARLVLSAGGGVFDPWYGSTGYEIDAAVMGTLGQSHNWRLGGEFAYRTADTGIQDVDNVDFDAYRISFLVHYRLLVGKIIEPYLGARLGFAVYRIDNHKIERERPSRDVNSSGFGVGASALAGIDVPLGDRFALYSEFSVSADVLWSDDGRDDLYGSSTSSDGVGGVTGVAGIRLRF